MNKYNKSCVITSKNCNKELERYIDTSINVSNLFQCVLYVKKSVPNIYIFIFVHKALIWYCVRFTQNGPDSFDVLYRIVYQIVLSNIRDELRRAEM
jgi:hypothetical protein